MLDLAGRIFSRSKINNPVFVIGTGRSGTSILLQALGEHSQILSADRESPFIPYVGYLLHPFEFRENRQYHIESLKLPIPYLYDQFRRLCFESVMGEHYGLRSMANKSFAGLFLGLFQEQYWCAKTYPNRQECEGLIRLFPGTRILYIFRNGYEVVHSRSRFRGMSKLSFEENCQTWADHAEKYKYLNHIEQAMPVRHEEIVFQPENTFRRILAFIGVNYENGPFEFSQSTLIHSQGKRTQTEVDVSQALKERRPAYEEWTEEQRIVFKQICSAGMHELGYEIPF
jgi:hypothetical protein